MVEIRPFKALTYDWDEVDGDPASVTAPPYDVLTAEEVERLKKTSLHNVTRLTLPDASPGKGEASKYTEAAKTLRRWMKEGVLTQTKDPSLYVYHETHTEGGARKTVRGFFSLLRLDPEYKEVRPHERTHKGPIEDRLKLLGATRMDLEPIQFLYTDSEGFVQRTLEAEIVDADPIVDFTDPSGVRHELWAVDDADTLQAVQAFFDGRNVYIADGHHRYATACHYAREARDGGPIDGTLPYDHKLSLFVSRDDPGIAVHPTHRLLSDLPAPAEGRRALQERFKTEPVTVGSDSRARAVALRDICEGVDVDTVHRFVFYWGDGEADILTLPHAEVPKAEMGDRSDAWKALDVSVLHHVVLPKTLGVDQDNAGEHLRYTRVDEEAVRWVDEGRHQCSIIMNATPLSAVTAVADHGEHMPQKSTYFQPKAQSGLLFSPIG
ncbi:MAG: DUF1015 domain-containing protein [Euryarchaeota archaeon]|nr:DUF1015 domain-containing protein [Euryarchaeota archaeon]